MMRSRFLREKRLQEKILKMRVSCRKAVDSGKQSGNGRVIATLLGLCNQIWSGPEATESMSSG